MGILHMDIEGILWVYMGILRGSYGCIIYGDI